MPVTAEHRVAIRVVPMISVGLADPAALRSAITVAGISWTEDVLITRNIHMASEATVLSRFRRCSSFIALIPKGVAAFPRPSILAIMFIVMAPIARTTGIPGNKSFRIGAILPEKALTRPGFVGNLHQSKPECINPNQAEAKLHRIFGAVESSLGHRFYPSVEYCRDKTAQEKYHPNNVNHPYHLHPVLVTWI